MATLSGQVFNLDEVLKNALHWTTELLGQQCDIVLLDTETGRATRRESNHHGRVNEVFLKSLFENATSAVRQDVVTERELLKMPSSVQVWMKDCAVESFLAASTCPKQKAMGILFISSLKKDQFTSADRELVRAIAHQLGNSVEKVLLYEEATRAYDNLRNTQEQLLQSDKMSAVGQLISGVAHELNNPLTAILGYAQLLETEPIGEQALDYVRKLFRQTQRTHRVVQNLLSFSRQRKPVQSQVDLRRAMEDTLSLRDFDLKLNNVTVEREYAPDLPFITGDAHQLEQVFLNIINNAVDAVMDSGRTGSVYIRMYPENGWACIEFQDSGPGLRDHKRIFDPFYTTKEVGKGSGLGLSICYGIVKEHGGDIVAFNHEQGGAVFQIRLPISGPKVRNLQPIQ